MHAQPPRGIGHHDARTESSSTIRTFCDGV
ncbi:hypothetical protein M2352_003501 [Azospirillum fermentarium]|nr:hypothetical protein [Azospirillum fermentarium]